VQLNLSQLNPICQTEWMSLIERSLQDRFVDHANKQIKETKKLLNTSEAKGVIFITSDGNNSLQPYDIIFFLKRTLEKKKKDRSPLYSNIHGIVYFSWSTPGYHRDIPAPILFWIGVPRDSSDSRVKEFMDRLESHWFKFIRAFTGQEIPRLEQNGINLQDIKIS
jgi:hypothetical protein